MSQLESVNIAFDITADEVVEGSGFLRGLMGSLFKAAKVGVEQGYEGLSVGLRKGGEREFGGRGSLTGGILVSGHMSVSFGMFGERGVLLRNGDGLVFDRGFLRGGHGVVFLPFVMCWLNVGYFEIMGR